jgi:hypothetical protein
LIYDNLDDFTHNLEILGTLIPDDSEEIKKLKISLIKLIEKTKSDSVFLLDVSNFLARFNTAFAGGELPQNMLEAKQKLDVLLYDKTKDNPESQDNKTALAQIYDIMFGETGGKKAQAAAGEKSSLARERRDSISVVGGKRKKSKRRRKSKKRKTKKGGRKTRRRRRSTRKSKRKSRRKRKSRKRTKKR